MEVIDEIVFPILYFLISANKNRLIIRILMGQFIALKEYGINNVKIFFTDKDMAQINTIISIWPNAHIQLYLQHIKWIVKQYLSSKKQIL